MNLWYRSNGELSRQRLKIKRMILTFLDLALLTDSRVSGFFFISGVCSPEFRFPRLFGKIKIFLHGIFTKSQESSGFFWLNMKH